MGEPPIEIMYLYHHLVIEEIYVMFTLTILNKIVGNVYDSKTETIDKGFRFHFRLHKKLPQIENFA